MMACEHPRQCSYEQCREYRISRVCGVLRVAVNEKNFVLQMLSLRWYQQLVTQLSALRLTAKVCVANGTRAVETVRWDAVSPQA